MKIYIVGSSKNKFLPLDNIREKFIIDEKHDGDNIDHLNPWYCELTGLYYLWKHVDDDIVGLEHYRRYFVSNNSTNTSIKLLSDEEINKLLKDNDIICIRSTEYSKNKPVCTWLYKHDKSDDFNKFLIFAKHYVGINYYNECLKILNGPWHCIGNMFIAKKELIDSYCEFIFDLLDKYSKAEKYYNRALPQRIMGYFTEFLFAAWLNTNNKRIHFGKIYFKKR